VRLASLRPERADGAMLAVVAMWATNNILIKATVPYLPPLAYVVGRFLIVLVLIWGWMVLRRMPASIALSDVPQMVLVGVTGFAAYNALVTIGMERTSAFSAALLMSLSPVFTLMLARLLGIERPRLAQWLAVALAAAGVAVFVGDNVRAEGIGQATLGDLLSLLGACAFAVYSLAVRPLTTKYGATVTTAWAVSIALLAVAPWGAPVATQEPWRQLSLPVWGSLAYSAVISMLVGYTIWSWAIARGGVSRTVPYLFLVPVLTGIVSTIALGEVFTPMKLVGGAMVLVGTALVRLLGSGMRLPGRKASAAESSAPAPVVIAEARGGN
jgi:drug/metabolite transporter (DMT)-like permease